MSKPRSPIGRMIDAACGVPDDGFRSAMIRICCPKCKREKSAHRDATDPTGAFTVEFECPACRPDGFDGSPRYFDAQGHEITPDWSK